MEIIQRNPNVRITEMPPAEWQRLADAVAPLHVEFGVGHEALIQQIINTR